MVISAKYFKSCWIILPGHAGVGKRRGKN